MFHLLFLSSIKFPWHKWKKGLWVCGNLNQINLIVGTCLFAKLSFNPSFHSAVASVHCHCHPNNFAHFLVFSVSHFNQRLVGYSFHRLLRNLGFRLFFRHSLVPFVLYLLQDQPSSSTQCRVLEPFKLSCSLYSSHFPQSLVSHEFYSFFESALWILFDRTEELSG